MCTGPGEPRAAWNQAWQLIGSLSTGLCAPSLQIPLNTVTRRAAEGKGSRRTQVLDPMMSPPVRAKSLHSCPTLCDPMDCSPPGSPVYGILQARILEWVAMSSRGSSRPRDRLLHLLHWQTGSLPGTPPGKPWCPLPLTFISSFPKRKRMRKLAPLCRATWGPPGLNLPAPTVQGVADDVGFGGVEARVEVDGDIWPGVQAAAALEVHLEPGGR